MKVLYSLNEVDNIGMTGVALGNFDGVHIGHQKLIKNMVDNCKENGLKSVVFTFINHPRNVTNKEHVIKKIIAWEDKVELLRMLGVEYLIAIQFDEYIRTLEPESFIKDLLVDKLNIKEAYCGYNYRYGIKASGNVGLLEEKSKEYNFEVSVLEPITIEGDVVSSTKIRELISEGHLDDCSKYLGRKYSLEEKVIRGKSNGKKMGFPTANIYVDDSRVIPPNGVYITKCFVNNEVYKSVTNIGFNPTLGGEIRSIETNIFDFDKDIYGENIRVVFYKRIRGEIKFNSIDELIKQMTGDVETAKQFFVNRK